MPEQDERFNYFLTMYRNDLRLAESVVVNPDAFPHIDPQCLAWELEFAWGKLEEMIPESHLEAIYGLL